MAYKKTGFIPKLKGFVAKVKRNYSVKAANRARRNQNRFLKKQANAQERYIAQQKTQELKQAALAAKKQTQRAKIDYYSQRGGIRGRMARNLQTKIAKGEADVELANLKPKLAEKSAKTTLETEAAVKKTKAQGAAFATAASALGGSYATKSVAESEATKAKAEADRAASEAISKGFENIPQVTTDPYAENSVSGLVTGVR